MENTASSEVADDGSGKLAESQREDSNLIKITTEKKQIFQDENQLHSDLILGDDQGESEEDKGECRQELTKLLRKGSKEIEEIRWIGDKLYVYVKPYSIQLMKDVITQIYENSEVLPYQSDENSFLKEDEDCFQTIDPSMHEVESMIKKYEQVRYKRRVGDEIHIYVDPNCVQEMKELLGKIEKIKVEVLPDIKECKPNAGARIYDHFFPAEKDDYCGTLGLFLILVKPESENKRWTPFAITSCHVLIPEEELNKDMDEQKHRGKTFYVATENGPTETLGKLVCYLHHEDDTCPVDIALIEVDSHFKALHLKDIDLKNFNFMDIYDGELTDRKVKITGAASGPRDGKLVRDDILWNEIIFNKKEREEYDSNDDYDHYEKQCDTNFNPVKSRGNLLGVRSCSSESSKETGSEPMATDSSSIHDECHRAFTRQGDCGALVTTTENGESKAVSIHFAKTRDQTWREDQGKTLVTGPLSISFKIAPALKKIKEKMGWGSQDKIYLLSADTIFKNTF